ncbi:hypothetical protein GBA52_004005 [Prunus armeniaca]|nr:hypothetical protein GBA52_004005 [Prunus armeniaca]
MGVGMFPKNGNSIVGCSWDTGLGTAGSMVTEGGAESRIEFPRGFSESDAELPPELFGGSIVGSDDGLPYDVSKSWQNLFSFP